MTHERKLQYDIVYMKVAEDIASLSYAKRSKVGCIIVSEDGQIVAQGFNGTPKGYDNCCEYEDENGELHTKPEVLHAESNAISKCAKYFSSTLDSTIYITLSPCIDCAKSIIQAGIKRIVFKELYRVTDGLELLKKSNLDVDQLVEDENGNYKLVSF